MCAVTPGAGQGTMPWQTGVKPSLKNNLNSCAFANDHKQPERKAKKVQFIFVTATKKRPLSGAAWTVFFRTGTFTL